MAITYKLEDQRVTFHWNRHTDTWSAKSEDIQGLDLEARSFTAVLSQLQKQHPEFSRSIKIFFPELAST